MTRIRLKREKVDHTTELFKEAYLHGYEKGSTKGLKDLKELKGRYESTYMVMKTERNEYKHKYNREAADSDTLRQKLRVIRVERDEYIQKYKRELANSNTLQQKLDDLQNKYDELLQHAQPKNILDKHPTRVRKTNAAKKDKNQ